MLVTACTLRRPCPTFYIAKTRHWQCLELTHARRFRTSTRRHEEQFPNHYETLSLQPGASGKEIKKQFYALSKSHHPDLHPNDPNASKRFVRISEAYAVLSAPSKRASYDRDFARVHQQRSSHAGATGSAYPSGSFSSAAAATANNPGGRPASGLSRRRTQFRGPPPSFYRSGGWGEQGAKRAEHAARPSHAWEGGRNDGAAGQTGDGDGSVGAGTDMPGTGPGGFAHGLENDVPHFDSRGHYQTHSTIERTRHRARRRVIRAVSEDESGGSSSGVIFGFLTVSSILVFGYAVSSWMAAPQRSGKSSSAADD